MVNDYQDRAKQFMPFDALKGLQDELRKKEGDMEEGEMLQFTAEPSWLE